MVITRFGSYSEFASDKKVASIGPIPKMILTGLNPTFYKRKFWFFFQGRIGTLNGVEGDIVFRLSGQYVWSYPFLWRGNGPLLGDVIRYFSQNIDNTSSSTFGETLKVTDSSSSEQIHPINFIAAIDEVEFVQKRQLGADGDQRPTYTIAILSERMLGAKSPNNLACHFA